ncbi:NADP-dependent phosphogluconate dehydrogenase [Candidatus Halobonum tyrrellensis]|uniref:6-phosphogluconate dehydrogenase-like protein n=1 Tax=Candidatus Halobonum tyrrellensis G22 TaxID=1324957 RepID=V4GXU4_9EURY|nr:NADP-dependent phosphogluconate dehydrogenase [Candidatus Halobonum tyrrellensis]ESP89981.1 6-phosphogluconate dehydrogenase-like protein [Candidatus Halobonum tyrrellensis G22]
MSEQERTLGIVGLGSIGGNLARQAVRKDIDVVGFDVKERPELEDLGVDVHEAGDYEEVGELDAPRVVYLSLPAGELIDSEIDGLLDHLEEGDVIMDGGNSFWRDSMRREEACWEEGVYFLDTGTSGGPPRAAEGACFMVGGREEGFAIAEPYLDALSVEDGLIHVGPPGSGHFTKLVHNGIEFGMLQAIAEGVELLMAGQFDMEDTLPDLFETWNNGAVIESWLVELMGKGLRQEDQQSDAPDDFTDIPNYIEDTGEVNWLVQEAFKGETPIPVITQSVMELFKSRGNQRHAYRAVALMRHGFGLHPFGEDEYFANERVTGRVENVSRNKLRNDESTMDTVHSTRTGEYPADPDEDWPDHTT